MRAGLERRDRVAGPPAQQRAADRHRRPHAHPRRGPRDRRRVPDHASGRKPNATNAVSTSSPSTSSTHVSAAGARRRRPSNAGRAYPAPAGPAASAPLRPRAGDGVQPAGPVRRRCRAGRRPRAQQADAWGKHLFHHYEGGRVVHVHLGLYGTFTESRVAMPHPDAVGQVRMRMVGAEYGTDLRGPTVCEVIDEAEIADVVAKLGPDPLRRDADPAWAWARIAKSRRPIGALLMDQTVIAGVGNVYRSELLFRHRIDPFRPGTHHRRSRIRRDVDRPRRADEGRRSARQDHRRTARARPRRTVVPARAGRAPTSTGARANRAGCAERPSAPRNWRAATCSGARPARAERPPESTPRPAKWRALLALSRPFVRLGEKARALAATMRPWN